MEGGRTQHWSLPPADANNQNHPAEATWVDAGSPRLASSLWVARVSVSPLSCLGVLKIRAWWRVSAEFDEAAMTGCQPDVDEAIVGSDPEHRLDCAAAKEVALLGPLCGSESARQAGQAGRSE